MGKMSGFFDSQQLGISCATCGKETKKSIGWLKSHDEFICPCGQASGLTPKELARVISDAEKELEKFVGNIKKLSKRLKL